MKYGCFFPLRPAGLIVLLAALLGLTGAQADEYSDVNQLMRSGKLTEAMSKIDRHLATKPRDPQMRFLKGVIQRESGRPADAIATFTRLTEDFPELPEPHNNLAVIYAGQGQYDKARAALEMAIRTNPSYATAHENLGDIYARLASQAYSKALQIDSGNANVQPKLALIRELFNTPGTTSRTAVAVLAPKPAVAPAAPAVPAPAPPPPVAAPAQTVPTPAVATAAAVPSAAAKPVVTPPAPGPTDSARDVEQAVRAWAAAWSDRNMTRYLAAYSKDFQTPDQLSRSAWEEQRRVRIVGKSHISVNLNNLEVTVSGDKAVAKFQQDYKADTLAVVSLKTLDFAKSGDRWLIVKEISGN